MANFSLIGPESNLGDIVLVADDEKNAGRGPNEDRYDTWQFFILPHKTAFAEFECSFLLFVFYRTVIKIMVKTNKKAKAKPFDIQVQFPRMHAPFFSCAPYNKSSLVRALTVNFKGELTNPELMKFREFQDALSLHLKHICGTELEFTNFNIPSYTIDVFQGAGNDFSSGEVNKFHPLIHPNKNREYPDTMVLKFKPEDVTFVDGKTGEQLTEADINFQKVEVEPTAWLRDIWFWNGTLYPRYLMTFCKIYTRGTFKIDPHHRADCMV